MSIVAHTILAFASEKATLDVVQKLEECPEEPTRQTLAPGFVEHPSLYFSQK